MRHVLIGGAVLVAAVGCSRDFEVPAPHSLAVSAAATTVAPRERMTLEATGAKPPLEWSLVDARSGADATVDAATGAYQAGSVGSAEDVVQVRDASGASARLSIRVGARLAVTPMSAVAAPGASVSLTVSGGKPPYAFEVRDAPSGGAFALDAPVYVVGGHGDCADLLRIGDATGDPAAAVEIPVRVTSELGLFAMGSSAVAPYESLSFVAFGGAPPYAFSVDDASGGATVTASGVYTAGANAGGEAVADLVRVTDANGIVKAVPVTVGPPLAVHLSSDALVPGGPLEIVAEGGRPPYRFAFAEKGNRSHGSLDESTGVYVPGFGSGRSDRIVVGDATGIARVPLTLPAVGPIAIGDTWIQGAILADLDADGVNDLAATDYYAMVHTYLARPGGRPREVETPVASSGLGFLLAGDLTGDGHPDLVLGGGSMVDVLVTGLDGAPVRDVPIFDATGRPGGVAPPSASRSGWSFVQAVDQDGYWVIETVFWPRGAAAPNAPTHVDAPALFNPSAWTAADVNDDGPVDLLWVASGGASYTLRIAYGPLFTSTASVTLPGAGERPGWVRAVELDGARGADLLVPVTTSDGRPGLAPIFGGATPQLQPVLPLPEDEGVPMTEVRAGPALEGPQPVLAFRRRGRAVARLRFGASPDVIALPGGIRIDDVVAGDANGDGIEDLVLIPSDGVGLRILRGDGGARYDERIRLGPLNRLTSSFAIADLDGDGADDLVLQDGATLSVGFGIDGEAGWAEPAIAPAPSGLTGNVLADPTRLIYVGGTGGPFTVPISAAGVLGQGSPVDVGTLDPTNVAGVSPASFTATPGESLFVVSYDTTGTWNAAVVLAASAGGPATDLRCPPTPTTCYYFQPHDLGGDGIDDSVVTSCLDPDTMDVGVYLSRALGPAGAPTGFGDWEPLVHETYLEAGGLLRIRPEWHGDLPVYSARDTIDPVRIFRRDRLVPVPVSFQPFFVLPCDLDGDGRLDLAMSDAWFVHVYLSAGADLPTEAQVLEAPGQLIGTARLTPDGPPDLLLLAGSDILVLHNDGTGHVE